MKPTGNPFLALRRQKLPLRPRYGSSTSKTSYTTRSRRPIPYPSRLVTHPAVLLLHISGLTFGTMLIPTIAMRYASSRAAAKEEPAPIDKDEPPYGLSPRQLRKLSSLLRSQITPAKKSFESIFTLRQLHLLKPPLPPPSHRLAAIHEPEKWLWRLPAAAAIHAVLRIVRTSEKHQELVPLAVTIATNALQWDTLLWVQLLKERGLEQRVRWEEALRRGGTKPLTTKGLDEVVYVRTELEERLKRAGDEVEREWERWSEQEGPKVLEVFEAGAPEKAVVVDPAPATLTFTRPSYFSSAHPPADPISTPPPTPSPPAVVSHPLSSLPPRTLEVLFLFLAQTAPRPRETTSTALALSLAMASLSISRSSRMLWHTFDMALIDEGREGAFVNDRRDLAAETWGRWVEQVQRTKQGATATRKALKRLEVLLMPYDGEFGMAPNKKTLASVAELARILQRQWAMGPVEGYSPVSDLMRLLARFPAGPVVEGFPLESPRRRRAKLHERVYEMTRKVFRDIVEDVIRRPIYLRDGEVLIDEPRPSDAATPPIPRLKLSDYNTLIHYSLHHFDSLDLAVHLVAHLRAFSLYPSAATSNILLPSLARSSADALSSIQRRTENAHTLPTFVAFLTSTSELSSLPALVYSILPELDTPLRRTSRTLPLAIPPPPGRNPYLYVTLLNALAKAGRTGLAERVFRSARWAAQLSREDGNKGWVLPPAAYTIMLQVYALEAQRGRKFEARAAGAEGRRSSPFVRGWGRHALRVFLLKERNEELRKRLGETVELRGSRELRGLQLPKVLRSAAAPIVSRWELEGGSSGLEMESLKIAMESEFSQSALETLYPGRSTPAYLVARWIKAGKAPLRGPWRETMMARRMMGRRRERSTRLAQRSGLRLDRQ